MRARAAGLGVGERERQLENVFEWMGEAGEERMESSQERNSFPGRYVCLSQAGSTSRLAPLRLFNPFVIGHSRYPAWDDLLTLYD